MARRFSGIVLLLATCAVLMASCGARELGSSGPCERARQKLTMESYEEARHDYARVMKNEKYKCAKAGLELVAIFTLADLGLHEEAKARLVAFTEQYRKVDVPPDLEYLSGGDIEAWRQVKILAVPHLLPLAEILATLAIVALAYFALRRRIWPWVQSLAGRRPLLDVQDFDSGVTGLQMGKGFSMLLEERIKNLGASDSGLRPDIITGQVATLGLPAALLPTPYLKILSELIEWAVPRQVVTLSGSLQAPGTRGAGLTLTLSESWSGEIVANRTVWQGDYGGVTPAPNANDPTPYYDLADSAAAWVFYQMEDRYGISEAM